MNESEHREAAENQAWDELLNQIEPIEIWYEGISDLSNLGNALRELSARLSETPTTVQEAWRPFLHSLEDIDKSWVEERAQEILQDAENEELADRLAREEEDLGGQNG